jgi:hypothetical protein
MKINNKFILLVAGCFAALSAELSTLAERNTELKEALKIDDMDKVAEIIIDKQQTNKIAETKSVDDQNYLVIIKKEEDGSYVRIAHFKKDKIGTKITEQVLLKIIEEADKKVGESTESMAYEFEINGTKAYAVISKKGRHLIFNITATKEEVTKLLGAENKPKPKKEEIKVEPQKEEIKPEPKKAEVAEPAKTEEAAKPAAE